MAAKTTTDANAALLLQVFEANQLLNGQIQQMQQSMNLLQTHVANQGSTQLYYHSSQNQGYQNQGQQSGGYQGQGKLTDNPPKTSTILAKADSGTSSHYFREIEDQNVLSNIRATPFGPTVMLPDKKNGNLYTLPRLPP